MRYFKRIFGLSSFLIVCIVLIYFRDNVSAVYVSAGLIWASIVMQTVYIRRLPKAVEYMEREFFTRILIMMILAWQVFEVRARIEYFGPDWDYGEYLRIYSIGMPMTLLSCIASGKSSYLYNKGIVIKGEALDFSQMDSFEWKKTAMYTLLVRAGGRKHSVMLDEKKFKVMDEKLLSEGVHFAGWMDTDE